MDRGSRSGEGFGAARILPGLLSCAVLGSCAALAEEISPVEILKVDGVSGVGSGEYSDRTLRVGIQLDRYAARVLAYTVKDRPYVSSLDVESPRAYRSGESLQLEIALIGPDDRRHTRRKSFGPICFDHDPGMEPHVEGDTMRPHRDSFVIELPEIAGFDRIEVAYYQGYRGADVRKPLGEEQLDRARFDPAGGSIGYGDLKIANHSEAVPISPTSSTVLWPEDFADPDLYRIDGSPEEGDRRLNIVIVPDGYTYSNKSLMEQHADELVDYLRETSPNAEHDPFFNYTLVYAYSVQNGTDQCDCGIIVDTAMGTRFPEGNGECGDSANRCLSYGGGCDESGTANIVAAELRAPYHDETIVMVNTTRYGGCAGSRSTYSAGNSAGPDVGTHELGHSVAGLADEYVSNSGCGSSGNNINTSTNATEGAWPEWISDLGPPREGARYWSECIYRPENGCKMRSLYVPFCSVCKQRWSLVVFDHSRISPTAPIESASSAPAEVLIDTSMEFSVTTRFAQGAGVTNEITWSVQGPGDAEPTVVATGVENYTHDFDRLGQYTVSCEVIADTNFIKPEKHDANRDVAVWSVESVATICEVGCADGIPECDADNDGLGDICDPCPGQPMNECFGPVALDNTALADIRINTDSTSSDGCSGDKTDCRGQHWIADFGAPESGTGYNQAGDPFTCDLPGGCPVDPTGVFGCSDPATQDLFRCAHVDPEPLPNLIYSFDVPDGRYLVNLLLMNASAATSQAGSRLFSVAINGEVPDQLARFDQVLAAGGPCDPTLNPCVGVNRSTLVEVRGDSGLTIEFIGEVDRPSIKGIEVLCSTSVWYRDADGDGFGDPDDSIVACYQPAGYVVDGTDCNDASDAAYPGAKEVCDTLDNDCNGEIDEDMDGDGFGTCEDCDESNPSQWSIPTEVLNLRFQDRNRLVWDEPADLGGACGRYEGLQSEAANDFTTALCLKANKAGSSLDDKWTPKPGAVLYYLVRATSSCGYGPLGWDSAGVERQGRICLGVSEIASCNQPSVRHSERVP